MIDSYIKIPDNVGTSFEIVNNNIILGPPESTYVGLSISDVNYYIPYYIKNLLTNGQTEWEAGIGKVLSTTIVERIQVSSSSNNNNFVFFTSGGTKTFFVYPNTYSINTAYNNLINVSGTFNVEDIRATYIVDLSSSNASGILPPSSGNKGLIVDFKIIDRNNSNLNVVATGSDLIQGESELVLDYDNAYTSLISDGQNWIQLKDNVQIDNSVPSSGTPQGDNGSLQYKINSTTFGGSEIYYDVPNKALLLGSLSNADTVISSSGNTIFNRNKRSVDFIVNGSGTKNLSFNSYGKLGINIPTGVAPQAIIHAIGTACDTHIKLENRSSCSVPKLTLYHKPSTSLENNSDIASIHLAAKNSTGSETDYVQLRGSVLSPNSLSTTGLFSVDINSNNNMFNCISASPTGILLKNTTQQLSISQSGIVSNVFIVHSGLKIPYITNTGNILTMGSGSLLQDSGYSIESLGELQNKASLSGAIFSGNITCPKIVSPLSTGNFIDFQNLNIVGSWKIDGNNVISADTSASSDEGKILTHTGSGVVWKTFNEYNFLWSSEDISWKKYPVRNCNIQNNADVVSLAVTGLSNEYSANDTVKINISGSNYYSNISQISESNGYTNIVLTSAVPSTGTATIISVSKGGYLDLSADSSGAPNISPQTIISTRPGLDTSFNVRQNDINFKVYGESPVPALFIQSFPTSGLDNTVPVIINDNSPNIISQNNNLNRYASLSISGYLYTDNIKIGKSTVPSGYILTSTSGNIAQWQSSTTINELDGGVIVFSGVNL